MKLTITNSGGCSLRSMFDPDEIEVAACLLELPQLIARSESRSSLPFSWGAKRKRSIGDSSNTSSLPPLVPPSSPPLPGHNTSASVCHRDVGPVVKDEAFSPASPLMVSFSPVSEREDRPAKRLKREKRKEELQQMLEECTKNNEILKKTTQMVTKYYEKLKAFNFFLKAKREELRSTKRQQEEAAACLERSTSLNQGTMMNFSQGSNTCGGVVANNQAQYQYLNMPIVHQQQPLVMDLMGVKGEVSDGYAYPNERFVCWAANFAGTGTGMEMDNSRQLRDERAFRTNAEMAKEMRHRRKMRLNKNPNYIRNKRR